MADLSLDRFQSKPSTLFVSGPPGIGKSSASEALARLLNVPMIDLDLEFEAQFGLIKDFVSANGWEVFRREESRILREVSSRYHSLSEHAKRENTESSKEENGLPLVIISLGGGTLLDPTNLELVSQNGVILTLWGSIDLLLTRRRWRLSKQSSAHRPFPQEGDGVSESSALSQVLSERYAVYRNCDLWLETFEAESLEQLAHRMFKSWRWLSSQLNSKRNSSHSTRFYRGPGQQSVFVEPRHSLRDAPAHEREEKKSFQRVEDTNFTEDLALHSDELMATGILSHYPIWFSSDSEDRLILCLAKEILSEPVASLSHLLALPQGSLTSRKIALFSDEVVSRIHAAPLVGRLQTLGFNAHLITFPAGEQSKRLRVVEAIITRLLQLNFDREDHFVAFGGGVTGDMCGFVASIYKRGVRWSQVPTTLLSQVDSSVGAKTAVNHPLGKNMIGTFYRPSWVWIDVAYLETLPLRELRSGWIEALKHGLILDRSHAEALIEFASAHLHLTRRVDPTEISWSTLIEESVIIKSQIVAADEREQGRRALLNLGHTLGHAIERAHSDLLHGEAVALGLVFTAEYSYCHAGLSREEALWLITTLKELEFEVDWRMRMTPEVLEHLQNDKKRLGAVLRFVSIRSIGEASLDEITAQSFFHRLQSLYRSSALD